ncbi:MAG: WecB/TagA/CpsF family glycosyltransferase [Chloroflexi bacterium]|nr:MAG: WecB/TagA/CpsF family glycosyltransferase [Chloroflexota bacterium]
MNRVLILGVPVDAISEAGAVEWVADAIRAGQPRQVATVNPEFIMRARHDGRFLNVLSAADLCIPDGYGVVWAARRLGHRLPSRVAGVDLIRSLAARGAREGWRFFFLGAGPGVAESAAAALEKGNPGLVVAGCLAGSPDPAQDTVTAAAVRSARTDLLLVAYGAPGQDLWIARNLHQSGARVAIGVGGAFDFISGGARRAPPWMRERGLEWLHRLVQEPWRWRRMLALPRFALAVLRQAR